MPGDHIDNDGNGYVDDVYGWDFYNNDNDPMDYRSHGTHVSGTIGAVGDNGVGVTGVNWNVSLMALKIADDDPTANFVSSSAATAALYYAADMRTNYGINIRVTSHSWGGSGYSTSLYNAIQANASAGILMVAAAGNDSRDNDAAPEYPASYNLDNIISVAATTRSDTLAGFSNYGATSVDLGAPGSGVYSTVPGGGYGTKSGTSMATPHVTGVAALAWSFRPDATYQEIKAAILDGADPIPALAGITVTGGRLNAARTLQLLGLNATPISPAAGAIVALPPASYTVQFSDDLDLATLSADDFQVNGIPADTLHVDTTKQITFSFNASPVTLEGLQTMTMAEGAVTRSSDGYALNALNATFRYDVTTLAVTSISPAVGTTATYPVTQIDVNFNEPIAGASVGLDDLVLSQGAVVSAVAIGTTSARYTVNGIETEGDVTVSLKSSSVTDTFGNPMAPYSGTFQLDVDERPLAGFTRVEPYGSLVSESLDNFGRLGTAADVDTLTIDALAGETLLAVLRPTNPAAVMTAEFEGLTTPVVGAPGAAIVVPLVQLAADQTVRLRISGDRVTDYTYDVYRNAELEPLGAGNSVGLAIDDSRIDIAGTRYALIASTAAGATTDAVTIDWTSASGQVVDILLTGLDGTSFAGQTLALYDPANQLVASGADLVGADTHDAQVGILGYQIGTPGVYTLRVTSAVAGRYSLVVTQGTQFDTEPNDSTSDTLRSLDATRSAVGNLGTRIENGSYTLALDTAATTFEGSGTVSIPSLGLSGTLKAQAAGSLTMTAAGNIDIDIEDGLIQVLDTSALDFIAHAGSFLPGGAPADLAADVSLSGLVINAALRNLLASAELQPVLLDANHQFDVGAMRIFVNGGQLDYALTAFSIDDTYDLDGLLAVNSPGLVGSLIITPGQLGLVAPVVAAIDGDVEISPGIVVEFSLVLTGQVTAALPFGDAQDLRSLTVQAGQVVTVSTRTPSAGGVSQDLDPLVNVYLPDGTLLASDANSLDGTNAQVTFLAPTSGVYTIGVAAESGFGEYQLDVDVADAVQVLPDDDNPLLANLVWTGTDDADHVVFTQIDATTIEVSLIFSNGMPAVGTATFAGITGRVIADALAGNDTIDGSGLTTTSVDFQGGLGDDTLFGGAAADYLQGDPDGAEGHDAGNDVIHGGDGNDQIFGDGAEGSGNDTIYGDAGNDTIYGDGAEGGTDEIHGGADNDYIDTGGGVDDVAYGDAGDDILLGGDGAEGASDQLYGGDGRDILIGDGGAGVLNLKSGGSDLLDGGAGEDLIIAGHYLATPAELVNLQLAWLSSALFADRVSSIGGTLLQPGVNLFNDDLINPPTTLVDQVIGGDDTDWLLYDFGHDTSDADATEQAAAVDLSLSPRPA